MSLKKPYIGGQAVIEGVMMRSPRCVSVAVRRPDGGLAVREAPFRSKLGKLWKLPGFRGVAMLVESLTIGFDALRFSAEQQMTEEERQKSSGSTGFALFLSLAFAIGLFIALPQFLAAGAGRLFGFEFAVQDARFHLVTGGFKLLVLLGYLLLISRLDDVRRVFQYHGAEHKTIYAYERGLPLTVENVRAQPRLHPRCGTTFLVVVVIVSIVAGSVATPLLLPNVSGFIGQALTLLLRIALLPAVAAASYELQRLSARYCTRGPLQALLWPGYLFQMITVREPDDAQIEIAIAAMQAAQWREDMGGEAITDREPLVFPSFESFSKALPDLRPAPPLPAAA